MKKDEKAIALAALAKRKKENKNRKRIDNEKLYAGSPMYFYCRSCGAEFSVPENYTSRPYDCDACIELKEKGWIRFVKL